MASEQDLVNTGWHTIRGFLPSDLDGLARSTGAMERFRKISGGESLLRCGLLWALPNHSIDIVAEEVKRLNLTDLSGTALFNRLVDGEPFFCEVLKHLFAQVAPHSEMVGDLKVVAVDGTSLCGPKATGTNQRLHVAYDLGAARPIYVDVTNMRGGETFRRFVNLGPGVLILADQGYGYIPGIKPLLDSKAHVLVRFNFHSIVLFDENGVRLTPEMADQMLAPEGTIEFKAYMIGWDAPLRVFGSRNPAGKGIWQLTDLDEKTLDVSRVRELYARRWQIELFFKRMKTILRLKDLPTREGPSARSWIFLKLILGTLAAIIDQQPSTEPEEEEPFEIEGEPPIDTLPTEVERIRELAAQDKSKKPKRKYKKRGELSLWEQFCIGATTLIRALFEPLPPLPKRGRPLGWRKAQRPQPKQGTFLTERPRRASAR